MAIAWIVFWVYWLASAFGAKQGSGGGRRIPLTGLTALSVVLLVRVFRGGSLAVHNPVLEAIGAVVFVSGIALAIWARVHLGRNWGMPMTQKAEPELVTSGPYRFVRHPIYSGLLAGVLGTALVTNLIGLIIVAVLVAYFYYPHPSRRRTSPQHSRRRIRPTEAARRCSFRSSSRRAAAPRRSRALRCRRWDSNRRRRRSRSRRALLAMPEEGLEPPTRGL